MKKSYGAFVLLIIVGFGVAAAYKPSTLIGQNIVDHLTLTSVERRQKSLREVEKAQAQLLADSTLDPSDILGAPATGPIVYDCDHYNILAVGGTRFAKYLSDNGTVYALFPFSERTFGKLDRSKYTIELLSPDHVPKNVQDTLQGLLPTLHKCRNETTVNTAKSNYLLSANLLELMSVQK